MSDGTRRSWTQTLDIFSGGMLVWMGIASGLALFG